MTVDLQSTLRKTPRLIVEGGLVQKSVKLTQSLALNRIKKTFVYYQNIYI